MCVIGNTLASSLMHLIKSLRKVVHRLQKVLQYLQKLSRICRVHAHCSRSGVVSREKKYRKQLVELYVIVLCAFMNDVK